MDEARDAHPWADGRNELAASTLHHSGSGLSHCFSRFLCAVFPFSLCSFQSSNQKKFTVRILNKIFLSPWDTEWLLWTALEVALAPSASGSGCLVPPPRSLWGQAGAVLARVKE